MKSWLLMWGSDTSDSMLGLLWFVFNNLNTIQVQLRPPVPPSVTYNEVYSLRGISLSKEWSVLTPQVALFHGKCGDGEQVK